MSRPQEQVVLPDADLRDDDAVDTNSVNSPVPQPRAPSRFHFWSKSSSAVSERPAVMDDPEYGRRSEYGSRYTDPSASLLNIERSPTETDCTWAKILCWTGMSCIPSGATLIAYAIYLASQNMKDIGETHIVCCTEAIGGTACACGACLLCGGVGLAIAAKRR